MSGKRFKVIALAAAGAVALGACGDSGGGDQASQPSPSAVSTPGGAAQAQAHNDFDVRFAREMIPHHQQAIEMSDMLLAKQGIDPRVVSLANHIKSDQGAEIDQMQSWLRDWGVTTSGSMPGHDMPGPGMPGGGMPTNGMPMGGHGMMSGEQMAALQNAQGAEAGRLFLSQMIEHHRGAITMSQQEIDGGQFPPAIEMARTIAASQQQEIDRMEGLLKSM